MKFVLTAVALLLAAGASKDTKDNTKTEHIVAKDITGTYQEKLGDGQDLFTLDLAQGDHEVGVAFEGAFGMSAPPHTCDCSMVGAPAGDGKWTLTGDATGTLSAQGTKIVIDIDQPPSCCGAGFPGAPDYKIGEGKPPKACKLKVAKASFADPKGATLPTTASKTDHIEAFYAGTEDDKDLVLTRATAAKKRTVGFLHAGDLDCPKD
jgi:hypothetical protein